MLRKILYYLRSISVGFYIIMIFFLLPLVFKSHWAGIIFLIMTCLFLLIILWSLLTQRRILQESISYNLIIIALACYLGVIVGRFFFDSRLQISSLYTVNMEYFKTNFIILSIVMLGVILNTFILFWYDKQK